MSDVFISYSRKNSIFARRLIDQLILANKDAWVDWEGIPLTSPNWWEEIKRGIEGADSFVFIISPDSMASVVCNMELDYALERQKRIIPVVHLEVVSKDAFASIADYQPDQGMAERLAGKDPLQIARNNWQQLSHINWVFPQFALAYNNRGLARADVGDLEGAIADHTRAIDLDPQDALAHNNRGVARRELGDLEGAIADYTEALRLDPQYTAAYTNRGNAHRELGDLESAIVDYTEAIRLDPQDHRTYTNRGVARRELGDLEGAIADFDEAIRLNPQDAFAYLGRGFTYYLKAQNSATRRSDLQQTLDDWRRAQQLGRDLPQAVLDVLIQIEAELGSSAPSIPSATPRP